MDDASQYMDDTSILNVYISHFKIKSGWKSANSAFHLLV